ncbi:hypothetical protein [Flavobacterium channae]|uniref:hypothetical protein n=1 Tax=Flavobacterium channae TaxID=2897181 RepID=UPI001E37BD10|nr:hypothetical protein [Flavobacterium channae]UGS24559.1 hypothetical protein LOS89_04620 [Flavobacterium channae]
MDLIDTIINSIDTNIILCLIPLILTLWITNSIFKEKYHSRNALNIIGWIIIYYSVIILIRFVIEVIINYDNVAIYNRATGPYWWSYWLMFFCAAILPFSLLSKKLRNKFWYVFIAAFCIKIGFYFERYVIIMSNLHRDYSPSGWSNSNYIFLNYLGINFLQGFLLAILTLVLYNSIIRLKNK